MTDAQDTKLTMTRAQAWAALEAAGIKLWRSADGKKTRAYEPGRQGAYMALKDGHRNERWASYPVAVEGADSAKVSGRFAAECRDALERARKSAEKAVVS